MFGWRNGRHALVHLYSFFSLNKNIYCFQSKNIYIYVILKQDEIGISQLETPPFVDVGFPNHLLVHIAAVIVKKKRGTKRQHLKELHFYVVIFRW